MLNALRDAHSAGSADASHGGADGGEGDERADGQGAAGHHTGRSEDGCCGGAEHAEREDRLGHLMGGRDI